MADCTWTSVEVGEGLIEYWLAGSPEEVRATPLGPAGTSHRRAVLGLKAAGSYELRPVVLVGGERVEGVVSTHVVPSPPADFPVLTLTGSDPARSAVAGGYLLLALARMQEMPRYTAVAVVDGDGDYVWWWRTGDDVLSISPRLSRDGRSVRFLGTDMNWAGDAGLITRVALDGSEVETTRALLGHHAMWENTDGTLSWLGFDYATVGGVAWAADAIRTVAEGSGDDVTPTEEFAWFDAYAHDPWEAVPGLGDEVRLGEGLEWTHSNSITAIDDQTSGSPGSDPGKFYVMAKNIDCLIRVDRATGAIDWQIGGQYGDFTHPDGSSVFRSPVDQDLFSHSHFSHVWDGGFAVFDNGDLHDPQVSRAVEYAYDEQARTIEEVWSYSDPDRGHTAAMGDVRKLANGHYLVAWSGLEHVDEVTPEGELVWQITSTNVGTFGRVTAVDDLYEPTVLE